MKSNGVHIITATLVIYEKFTPFVAVTHCVSPEAKSEQLKK